MLKDRESILVLVAALVLGVLWWRGYVSPKHDTLDAAAECMYANHQPMDASTRAKALWGTCLQEAEAKHASPLLMAFGY